MKKLLHSFFLFLFCAILYSQDVGIVPFATGFNRPLNIQNAGDDRLFVVEQGGLIKIIQSDGSVNASPFLDISDRISMGGERGLLGLVFHPNYAENGLFYVNYTDLDGNTQISRFSVNTSDVSAANAGSELEMLNLTQPFSNHNGGCLSFGPDGFLYIGLGDGGDSGDPGNRSQDTSSLYGSILRIDVNGTLPYAIPDGNPFAGDDTKRSEIWGYGLRNPWKFSFDSTTGDLWIADVGQNAFEEINKVPFSLSGANYGWRCYEGNTIFNANGNCPDDSDLTFSVAVYPHENNRASITGGYVYRGDRFPDLKGTYIFADFVSNELGTLDVNGYSDAIAYFGPFPNTGFSSFGINNSNELYVAGLISGIIYAVVDQNALGLNQKQLQNIALYPNPANGVLNVSLGENEGNVNLAIFDILGKKVLEKSITSAKSRVNISNLKKGIYFATIESAELRSYTQKLIVK
ncbi:PQQ-dependent sugar dehydrogenase [Flavimarina sp. Hel_I_48]|uniref:PQQ-dependent sugar dehydrogenase n=1 Tax=Flavimarina sp. Hel_I_48 TaxID=1392488 RepID=UPI0004DFCD73|nr:PQQ-dependent sugar dehydrogenase [Flavimarina sp. Hel_I_48]